MQGHSLWQICHENYFPLRPTIRSEHTRAQYAYALRNFAECLGRTPTLKDLTDDRLAQLMQYLLDRELAERTVNERVGRLKSLWNWLAKRGKVRCFPTLDRIPEPQRIPRAWTADELRLLFHSFGKEAGTICGIPATLWWLSSHAWLWNTGERKGATFLFRFDMLDWKNGVAILPPDIRKGRRKAAVYYLWPDVLDMLREIRYPRRDTVWPWPFHPGTFYNHYTRILNRAGLPHGRYNKTHCMRVSHATWLHALGHDATAALGHGSPETTRNSYLDPRLIQPIEKPLFRPW